MGDRRVIATPLFNYSRSVFWTKDVDSNTAAVIASAGLHPASAAVSEDAAIAGLKNRAAVPGIVSRLLPLLYSGTGCSRLGLSQNSRKLRSINEMHRCLLIKRNNY